MPIHLLILGDRNPAFRTHQAIDASIALLPDPVRARWVATDSDEALHTDRADAVWVVPGSPYRHEDAVLAAIRGARESGQPFLGTCAGFQYAVLEFARNVAGIRDADHAETVPSADHLVVERLACSLIGEERMVTAVAGSRTERLCGADPFLGFHWCNFGLAPAYVERLTRHGLVVSARSDDAGVEAVELPEHPFFLATLFQPQVGALTGQELHPLIAALVDAAQRRG